jgi:hypothetical protein
MAAVARLSQALDRAVRGQESELLEFLARNSRLPGPRPNDALVNAFASLCVSRGTDCDALALSLARMTPEHAPGATALEFLPMCGIAALSARAAIDARIRQPFLAELHTRADDRRFRVREAVVDALARIGTSAGHSLLQDVGSWMDGYFHAAAVASALARTTWLSALRDPLPVLERLEAAFILARDAPRAAARYPGRKELIDAIERSMVPVALRFGEPVFDMLVRWTAVSDPELRRLIGRILDEKRLSGRFGSQVERTRSALHASEPPVRNPDHNVGRTRDRSGARRRDNR